LRKEGIRGEKGGETGGEKAGEKAGNVKQDYLTGTMHYEFRFDKDPST
jgi:hypothetical protein